MKFETIKMYKYPSMIKTMGFCAASFALLSVLLKTGIVLIPEVSEVRICNALACSYGIWFGPAGAWGCALGNLIGDLGGSFTILTPFGFIANFLSAWVPYRMWNAFSAGLDTKKWALKYLACGVGSAASCCAVLGLSFDYFGSMPAVNSFVMTFCNNLSANILGLVLFAIMRKIPALDKLYWPVQMQGAAAFEKGKPKRLAAYSVLSLSALISAFSAIYMASSNISFTQPDIYKNPLILILYLIYLIATVLLSQFMVS